MQHVEQRGAVNAKPRGAIAEFGIAQVHDHAPAGSMPTESGNGLAPITRLVQQPKRRQRGLSGWLQKQTRSDRSGLIKTFHDGNIIACAGKRDGRRLTGNAAAYDCDVQDGPLCVNVPQDMLRFF